MQAFARRVVGPLSWPRIYQGRDIDTSAHRVAWTLCRLGSTRLFPWLRPSFGSPRSSTLAAMPRAKQARSSAAEEQAGAPTDVPAVEPANGASDKAKPAKKKSAKPFPPPSVDPNDAELRSKALRLIKELNTLYPDPPIPLNHQSTFQLLVAVVLSAQTTDLKVNECTPSLFSQWPDAATLAKAEVSKVAHEIRTLGLGPTKAKNIVALSQMLVEHHSGEVPNTFEALEALPGVGHKTASVVMAQAFGVAAFPVDTHIHRLAQRWGLTNGHSVEQSEVDLKTLFPEDTWRHAHLQIIYFGREHCPAQGHDPSQCLICSWAAVPPYNKAGVSPARPGQKPPASANRKRKIDTSSVTITLNMDECDNTQQGDNTQGDDTATDETLPPPQEAGAAASKAKRGAGVQKKAASQAAGVDADTLVQGDGTGAGRGSTRARQKKG